MTTTYEADGTTHTADCPCDYCEGARTVEVGAEWGWSVYNQSTGEYVVEVDEFYGTRDEANRQLQAWLLAEADAADSEDDAQLLDDAAQRLNYAEYAHIGGTFDWTVETVGNTR